MTASHFAHDSANPTAIDGHAFASNRLRERLIPDQAEGRTPAIHFVGVCGSGMKSLVDVISDAGWQITGSDFSQNENTWNELRKRNLIRLNDVSDWKTTESCDLLIYSAAVPESDRFRQVAEQNEITQISYVEALARITNPSSGIAVCGTHGKSSTTSLLSHFVHAAGVHATTFCGAQQVADGRSGRLGFDDVTIVEACEFREHFLQFRPKQICLLGIEPDHFDCFPTLDDAIRAYDRFLQSLPVNGILTVNWDCETSRDLARKHERNRQGRVVSYSLTNSEAQWTAHRSGHTVFIHENGREVLSGDFPLPGEHALRNLLAAIATLSASAPIDEKISSSIREYCGLKRRFEVVSQSDNRVVIDDFAHHPTEIRVTLETARQQYPDFQLVCYFQPHQVSRTRSLLHEFADLLRLADEVFVLPVFAARETLSELQETTAEELARLVAESGTKSQFLTSLDPIRTRLETTPRTKELIITLGAGDIAQIHDDRT
ncbi:UDP-N-acetylmuramate--L-alanine ligase MurC [Thalassoglobus neptunius]|uniref:UDP-N-acetylmuramate--L-alanine ligase MurC n=1 Tax=Thalassoglobus neptunius TaxID=1938619 RepID=A0A5C5WMV8_9PLAN|nr:Mur ligase family protein [Thalassoglobus neptunius]TWT51515.1 UDP-N-acetylmuramate--L-alanine ligase MurC [Thalassoglobus neptunius]